MRVSKMLEQFREDIRKREPDGTIVPCLSGLETVEWLPLKISDHENAINENLDEVIRLFEKELLKPLSLEYLPNADDMMIAGHSLRYFAKGRKI